MGNYLVPRQLFFTKGVGVHKDRLVSFEMALRAARIPQFNLVTVSSILPPRCEIIPIDEGLPKLSAGQIVFCVLARMDTDEAHRPIAASVGMAIPSNRDHYGYISELHCYDMDEQKAGDYAEHMALTMLSTAIGKRAVCEDDPASHRPTVEPIEKTLHVTQTALGDDDGRWTTVVSAAVLVMPSIEELLGRHG